MERNPDRQSGLSLAGARLRLIFCTACWGTISLFVRGVPLSSAEISLWRALIALVVILLYRLLRRHTIPFAQIKKALPFLCLSGAAMGVNWILLFEAYRFTTVSVATLSYYFAPVILMLVCPLLFHERLTLRQILCFGMATVGLVLVIGIGNTSLDAMHLKGILFGLGAAVLYATVVLINKKITGISGVDRTLLQFLVAALILLPYVLFTGGIRIGSLPALGVIQLLVLGIVHTGLCYCMYFDVVSRLRGQETAILSYIDPLVAILVSVCFFGEGISPVQLFGGVLILGFTLYNELAESRAR